MDEVRDDSYYMKLALKEAATSLQELHIPVGSVIVLENKVISRGRNQVNKLESVFAHAEMQAMLNVQQLLYRNMGKCTIYTTLEPCMMCLGAIIYNKFARLVVALQAPIVGGLIMLDSSKHYQESAPVLTSGLMEEESKDLIKEYVNLTGLRKDLLEQRV